MRWSDAVRGRCKRLVSPWLSLTSDTLPQADLGSNCKSRKKLHEWIPVSKEVLAEQTGQCGEIQVCNNEAVGAN